MCTTTIPRESLPMRSIELMLFMWKTIIYVGARIISALLWKSDLCH